MSSPEQGRQATTWDYAGILWRGRWVLFLCVLLTSAIAVAVTFTVKKRYRATAMLEIRLSSGRLLGSARESDNLRGYFDKDQAFKTEFVRMRARGLLQQALDRHDLLNALPDLQDSSDPVELIRRLVSVERVPQTNVARVRAVWFSAEGAALLANSVVDTYCDVTLESQRERGSARVESLKASAGSTGGARRQFLVNQLAELEGRPDPDKVFTLTVVEEAEGDGFDSLRNQWREVRTELREKEAIFGPNHPERRAINRKLGEVRSQINEAVAALRDRLEKELAAIGGATEDSQFVAEPERVVDEEIQKNMLEAIQELTLITQLAESRGAVLDPAVEPRRPFAPRLSLNLALAAIVGLGFGSGILLFRDHLDTSVRSIEHVEEGMGLPLLAVVPKHGQEIDAVSREAYQTLRTGLVFASGGQKGAALITSTAPAEGKSSVSLQLARALASTGSSVLLLDGDLRRPGLTGAMAGQAKGGLTRHLIADENDDWRDHVVELGQRLSLMPTGPLPPNPLQVLGMPRFRALLDTLRAEHDWLIVDSPPAGSVSDALVLADVVQDVVLVLRHDKTDRDAATRISKRLEGVGARVAGAVLNGVDMKQAFNRRYYGRFQYGRGYGQADVQSA
ncbi:MAG: polysaccharide biosynthesis tyrosine autokinase [Acidobacteriota bacterium]